MEEKITGKIERIVDYIVSKPLSKVTLDDFTILHSVLKDIQFRRNHERSCERFRQLMASAADAE